MGTGYTRADVSNNIADGNIINASDLDSEFDAVQAAFDAATGHTHDGTTAEGAPIEVTGPAQEYVSTNTEFRPKANNTYDLGSAANQWKDLYVDGTANLDAVDIDGGNIDGTTIGAATPAAGTFTTATATTGNITTVNATTVDTTNIEVTNIKAKDGTAAGSIADATGVVTLASSVLTTTDINGGTIDGATIGGASAAAGTFTTATATTGNITTVNATTVDSTNVEVTNIKAKDGTASATIADSTGVMTIASSVLTTADINGGTIDGVTLGTNSAVTEAQIDNININGNAITSTDTNGNIALTPNGTGEVDISKVDIDGGTIDGVTIGGASAGAGTFTTLTATGNVTLGDAATDTVTITADVASNIIPSADNTYDLGASGSEWKDLYIDGTANIDSLVADTADINGGTIDGTVIGGSTPAAISGTTGQFGTSLNVDGTVTADGLTVDGGGSNVTVSLTPSSTFSTTVDFTNASSAFQIVSFGSGSVSADNFRIRDAGASRLNIAGNGDISFYEDTGTTPKFFWDASAESLGIGTSSPVAKNHIRGSGTSGQVTASWILENSSSGTAGMDITGAAGASRWRYLYGGGPSTGTNALTEAMCILTEGASAGNVGIGRTNPTERLSVQDISLTSTTPGANVVAAFRSNASGADTTIAFTDGVTFAANIGQIAGNLHFRTANFERMRIDTSGNLLVGKTSSAFGTAGIEIDGNNDRIWVTRSGAEPLVLNRLTNDGNLLEFYKDGTAVGSIGSTSSLFIYLNGLSYAGNGDTGLVFDATNDVIRAFDPSTGGSRDDAIDLGQINVRFDDIYATNGTIQTSDRNEKQDIEELSEAERRVAVAAKGLLRKFRWKSAVEEKGDDARIHFGIIAQDLQAAFEAEGLDAGRYAMFIHSTWTDEETGEEKSRMGVRYSELLAFIIAAI